MPFSTDYQYNTTVPQAQPNLLSRISSWLGDPSNQAMLLNAGSALAGQDSTADRLRTNFLPGVQGQIQEQYQQGKEGEQKAMTLANIGQVPVSQLLSDPNFLGATIDPATGKYTIKSAGEMEAAKAQSTRDMARAAQAQAYAAQIPGQQQSQPSKLEQTNISNPQMQQPVAPISNALGSQPVNPTYSPRGASGRGLSPEQLLAAQVQSRANVGQPYNNALNQAQQVYQGVLARKGEQDIIHDQPVDAEMFGLRGKFTSKEMLDAFLKNQEIEAIKEYRLADAGNRADYWSMLGKAKMTEAEGKLNNAEGRGQIMSRAGGFTPEEIEAGKMSETFFNSAMGANTGVKQVVRQRQALGQLVTQRRAQNVSILSKYGNKQGPTVDQVTGKIDYKWAAEAFADLKAKAATGDPDALKDYAQYGQNEADMNFNLNELKRLEQSSTGTAPPISDGLGSPQPAGVPAPQVGAGVQAPQAAGASAQGAQQIADQLGVGNIQIDTENKEPIPPGLPPGSLKLKGTAFDGGTPWLVPNTDQATAAQQPFKIISYKKGQ